MSFWHQRHKTTKVCRLMYISCAFAIAEANILIYTGYYFPVCLFVYIQWSTNGQSHIAVDTDTVVWLNRFGCWTSVYYRGLRVNILTVSQTDRWRITTLTCTFCLCDNSPSSIRFATRRPTTTSTAHQYVDTTRYSVSWRKLSEYHRIVGRPFVERSCVRVASCSM